MTQAAQLAQYGANNVGLSFKNRIINGDMTIDQRNNGAAVTSGYAVDRFNSQITNGAVTMQQSSVAPTGFTKSLLVTVTSASTPGATDRNSIIQNIEGFNIADFGLGTATPSSFTLSFWVRSSLTGTFSGMVGADTNPSYVYTYVINAANTWEYKTITIPGTSTGTWGTTNGFGLTVRFDLGTGSDRRTTPNVWNSADFRAATGAVQLIANSGATWQVTGVQIEKGTVATSFDYLPYGTELMLCQRYCCSTFPQGTAWGQNRGINGAVSLMTQNTSARQLGYFTYPVTMRASPTLTTYNPSAANAQWWNDSAGASVGTAVLTASTGDRGIGVFTEGTPAVVSNVYLIHISASAEL